MSDKKKNFFGMNIGSSSLLMIFVILCLVSFAALSIVSANADRKLTAKVAERTASYYEACNSAQASLSELDRTLAKQYAVSPDEESYFKTVGRSAAYEIPVTELQTLLVEVEILYPRSDEETYYRLKAWRVVAE